MKTEILNLECVLTDTEKLAYSKEMAAAVLSRTRAEENLARYSKQMKSEICDHGNTINLISDKLNTGKELREIECSIDFDTKRKEKVYYRMDTGELVKRRKMTAQEMQGELDL